MNYLRNRGQSLRRWPVTATKEYQKMNNSAEVNKRGEKFVPEYSTILFEVRDKVAHLTLNRPEAANSLNATVSAEMMEAVVRCEDDADIRALVVTGTGRFFCAGADLKGFYSAGSVLKSPVSIFHRHLPPGACRVAGNRCGQRRRGRCRNGTRLRV
jgi:hypothetical protein